MHSKIPSVKLTLLGVSQMNTSRVLGPAQKIKSEISLTSQIFLLDSNEVTLKSNGDF